MPSSTPSSPTECSQVETVAPPPLIPIDSLDEVQPASPDDDHDDASDRLSIVDMNESIAAESNSVASTPKPSDVESPLANYTASSSTTTTTSRVIDSLANTSTAASSLGPFANAESNSLPSESDSGEHRNVISTESNETIQSPQSSVPAATTSYLR